MSDNWSVVRIGTEDLERVRKLCIGKCKPPSVITALLNFAEAMGVVGVEILPGPEDGAKIPVVLYEEI